MTEGGGAARRPPALLVVLAVVIAVIMLAPVAQLIVRALGSGGRHAAAILFRQRTLELFGNTLLLAVLVSAACLVLGVAIAVATVRVRLPFRPLWPVLACLPLAVPSFVGAFAWSSALPQLHGLGPLVIVTVLTTVPLVTVPTIGALALADHGLADVARTLGRSRSSAFFTVTLPQILPAAVTGTLLVALYTISDFGSPAILRYETLTTGVYALFSGGIDRSASAVTSLALVAFALVLVLGERRLRGDRAGVDPGSVQRGQTARPLGTLSTLACGAGLGLVAALGVLAPLIAMTVRWLSSERFGSTMEDLAAATVTTLLLGAVAATVTVVLALPIGVLAARYRSRLIALAESVSYLTHAIPGVVVALALVALSLALVPAAYQSAAALIAAYVVLCFSLAIGALRSAIARVPPRLEEVSRTLGHGPFFTWWRVTVRTALPGIVAGWVLVATAVMKELPATLMLRPIGVDTLATELWSKTSIGAYGAAAPIGVLLVLVGLVPAMMLAATLYEGARR